MVKNREVAEMAKLVMRKHKEEVEKKGFKLSVSENGKEGKSEMIEDERRQFSNEGVTLTVSVATLAVDLRKRVKRLGAKEIARRKKCSVRFSNIKKIKAFQERCMKVEVKKL